MPNAQIALIPGNRDDRPEVARLCVPAKMLLLVEDSRFAAESVRLLCRGLGIRLRRAASLAEATAHLSVYRPDVVLIDIGLPDGSGLSLIEDCAFAARPPERIIAISGDEAQRRYAMAAGADEFLLKPISLAYHLMQITGTQSRDPAEMDSIEDTLRLMKARPDPRNEGMDPLALIDDLRVVRALIEGESGVGTLAYAGQFLQSLARTTNRPAVAEAVVQALKNGDQATLLACVSQLEPSRAMM